MTSKKKTVLLASILAGAAMTLSVGSAEARHGGWSSGGGHWGGSHMRSHAFVGRPNFAFSHRPHFRHHHHRFLAVAPFYYSDYGYGDSCYWLKRRALYTGSGYWWNRYYGCINGYGYY